MPALRQTYPILHIDTACQTIYRHQSINPTLYFQIVPDKQKLACDPEYQAYFEQAAAEEAFKAIVSRFILAQPLYIVDDDIPFILLKTTAEPSSVEQFCRDILQEISFHTGIRHSGLYGLDMTMALESGKEPGLLASILTGPKGGKLTSPERLEQFYEPLDFEGEPRNHDILLSMEAWKKEKQNDQAGSTR